MSDLLDKVADLLGYRGDPGYVLADSFASQPNHRHALRLAAQLMNVRAAFGLWTGSQGTLLGPEHARFTPLVYLAAVSDAADAMRVHRSVWSQGLAPYLVAVGPDRLWVCQGFGFSSSRWERYATEVSIDPSDKLVGIGGQSALAPLSAKVLRSSLAWRDEARTADEFVDERLLRSLADLSVAFSAETRSRRALAPSVINALIARLLYFYFLVDRGFITPERLAEWELTGIGLGVDSEWSSADIKTLFGRLDEVFNGSIFPMPKDYADAYDAEHLNLLRRVLRHGAELGSNDALQLSFLDYDFASIRTETLSAIYEMFLRNENREAGKRFGAFYTPPFLADYALDRVEEATSLNADTRVFDPAAGSGVFLVGAYRRIVESALTAGEAHLPLDYLHTLMTERIFGVELNATACHVAAFSLYLTMLDYVEPKEAADYARWPVRVGRRRLFPPMLTATPERGANIRVGDFFSDVSSGIACDVVVGNPPWVQLGTLDSDHANDYHKRSKVPIGDKQVAELFLWKAYHEHLKQEGVAALLLPQKSLVNTFSDKFTRELRTKTELIGIADFAHLRYALFRRSSARTAGTADKKAERGARQATAAVILRKATGESNRPFWLYRPLRSTQPASRKGRLWTLLQDWTQVLWQDADDLTDAGWRHLFTCSPVDRRVLAKLDRQIASGRLQAMRQLNDTIGLQFKIEVDQNLDSRFVLSNDSKRDTFWKYQLGRERSLFPARSIVPLPSSQLERAVPGSRPYLMGNVVLLPRNCETAIFVELPVATSFFIVACFPKFAGEELPARYRRFLEALALYMASSTFRYLCFVSGRRMTIDRANIELSTVLDLPWPFGGLERDDWADLLTVTPEEREAIICAKLGLPPLYQRLIDEFNSFREGFTDGGTPDDALRASDQAELETYIAGLLHEIDGGRKRYSARVLRVDADLLAVVIEYVTSNHSPASRADYFANKAIETYNRNSASAMTQSRFLWQSREEMASVLVKPGERMHWTLERAFADADLITAAAMAGFDSKEAV
ncbi:class I SAM-dependent DNA methyltransferase [Rhizobium sp. WYJ-E13]|uniref:HsdM family class I SAM-dependent methyltransferase n=1 Tax=Rhizobium sp. WYJ-E13 TaxID=2849093 RepID=UPI001C1E9612|nr:N-6 DNA methylase [Rhizobium sp. WYJ-E13]QWW72338.1 SAM-dependent methyltransferase [Rhizobium sp. WYJ-E13]